MSLLREIGYASAAILKTLVGPMLGKDELIDSVGYVVSNGLPTSVVPDFIGQHLYDSSTPTWYKAHGVAAGQWTLSGVPSNVVLAQTDPVTGGIDYLLVGGTKEPYQQLGDYTPILILCGDHPYKQWWGNTGSDGMAQIYADLGLTPTLAINTGVNCYDSDPVTYMPYNQIVALQDRLEVAAHGHLHQIDWRLINTGITVTYTGANATATAQVTAANLVLVDSGTTNLALATYTTISALVAAVNAVSGWAATMSGELVGTEASTSLLLLGATSAKAVVLPLCAGGGILITNTGETYRRVTVTFSGTNIAIHGDGVRKLSLTIAGNTLSQVVTAINAVGGGITAELTNDTPDNGVQYCSGSEDATCLANYYWTGRTPVTPDGVYLFSGLNRWYIVDRQLQKCRDVLDANGLANVQNFVQPGNRFYPKEINSHNQFKLWRGGVKTGLSISPGQFRKTGLHFSEHTFSQAIYPTPSTARLAAVIEALIDSPGFCIAPVVHNLYADGSSGYTLLQPAMEGWNQKESDWLGFLRAAALAKSQGKLKVYTMDQYRRFAPVDPAVSNLLFNPRLKNSGESLLTASADAGKIVPGWRLQTIASACSAASIENGFLSFTNTAASTPLQQVVTLSPGWYEIGCQVISMNYTSGSGFMVGVEAPSPDSGLALSSGMLPGTVKFFSTSALRGAGEQKLQFSIDPPKPMPPRAVSVNAQPYNLGTNKNIRMNIDGKGNTADIDCSAGAVSAVAATAKEVAAAINAGMVAAAATYGAEYHTIAKAVNGHVVLEAPYITGDVTSTINVADGTTLGARSIIFGDEVFASALLAEQSMFGGVPLTISYSASFVGSATIGAFYLRRVLS